MIMMPVVATLLIEWLLMLQDKWAGEEGLLKISLGLLGMGHTP